MLKKLLKSKNVRYTDWREYVNHPELLLSDRFYTLFAPKLKDWEEL
jgi:hypothetical protein